MPNNISPAKAIRLTFTARDGKKKSKTFITAKSAAQWWTLQSWGDWWRNVGCHYTGPNRYDRSVSYSCRLERRLLKVMKGMLP